MQGAAKPAPLLDKPLVVTGHMVTFDPPGAEIADGALYIDRGGPCAFAGGDAVAA